MIALAFLAFLLLPLAEIYVIVQVGEAIGAWETVLLLLVWSALGAYLVRREGRRAWARFTAAAGSGRLPGREVADGALVLAGGLLLLTPGFITDGVGLALMVPPTRPLARRLLTRWVARRTTVRLFGTRGARAAGRRGGASYDGSALGGEVIEGEVVEGDIGDGARRSTRRPPDPGHG